MVRNALARAMAATRIRALPLYTGAKATQLSERSFCLSTKSRVLPLISSLLALSACGHLKQIEDTNRFTVSAEPLLFTPEQIRMASLDSISTQEAQSLTAEDLKAINSLRAAMYGDIQEKKALLGAALYDSERKCGDFLSRVSVAQTGVNTTGDILTTVLSGIATAISPLSLSHGFSAASTIVGGTKTALDQDLWAKAGIQDFQKALATSYYISIRNYTDELEAKTGDIVVSFELTRIQSIHDLCSLSAARNVIDTTLSRPLVATRAQPERRPSGKTRGVVPGQSLESYIAPQYTAAELRVTQNAESASRDIITGWLHPGGKLSTERENALQTWIMSVARLNVPIPNFLRDPRFETARQRAIKEFQMRSQTHP